MGEGGWVTLVKMLFFHFPSEDGKKKSPHHIHTPLGSNCFLLECTSFQNGCKKITSFAENDCILKGNNLLQRRANFYLLEYSSFQNGCKKRTCSFVEIGCILKGNNLLERGSNRMRLSRNANREKS